MPHKFSDYGPAMAVGDVNNDGLDDIFIGGSGANPTTLLLQQKDGTFINKNILPGQNKKNWDDMGLVLFDADNDGDLDLYIATGGYQNAPNGPGYEDKLYLNDGKGISHSIRQRFHGISPVNPAFAPSIMTMMVIWIYLSPVACFHGIIPRPVSCAIYRNDYKGWQNNIYRRNIQGGDTPAEYWNGL